MLSSIGTHGHQVVRTDLAELYNLDLGVRQPCLCSSLLRSVC